MRFRLVVRRFVCSIHKLLLEDVHEPQNEEDDRRRARGEKVAFESYEDTDSGGSYDPGGGSQALDVGVFLLEEDHSGTQEADAGHDRTDEVCGVKPDMVTVCPERHGHELTDYGEQHRGDADENVGPQSGGLTRGFALPAKQSGKQARDEYGAVH